MTNDFQTYKAVLQKELEETKRELNQLVSERDSATASSTTDTAAPDELATNLVGIETDATMQHVLEEKIEALQKALVRLDTGSFGLCASCKQAIDPARLKAFPAAETCMDCSDKS